MQTRHFIALLSISGIAPEIKLHSQNTALLAAALWEHLKVNPPEQEFSSVKTLGKRTSNIESSKFNL